MLGTLSNNPSTENSSVQQEAMQVSVTHVASKESVAEPTSLRMTAEDEVQYNVAELTGQGQRIVVACGGEGGLGNVCAPNVFKNPKLAKSDSAEELDDEHSNFRCSSRGLESVLILELKSIAHVGLVGMPKAGKSTLLGALSRAKPRVGHYAFTTLQWRDLVLELEFHQEGLSDRPCLVVANKIDEIGAEEALEELRRRVEGVEIYPICAVLEEGVAELKEGLRMLVNSSEKSQRLSF